MRSLCLSFLAAASTVALIACSPATPPAGAEAPTLKGAASGPQPVACQNDAPDKTKRAVPEMLAQMYYFKGTWRCDGKAEKSHLWEEHKTASTMTISEDLNGAWLGLRMAEDAAEDNKLPLRASGWWGYDAASKNLVRTFATNYGGWGEGKAPGWQGDKLVWTGGIKQGNGQDLGFRHTITKVNERSFREAFEVQVDGNWVLRGSSTCAKQ